MLHLCYSLFFVTLIINWIVLENAILVMEFVRFAKSSDCFTNKFTFIIFSLLNGTKVASQMPWDLQLCSFWLLDWMAMLIRQSGWKIYLGKFGHHQMYDFTLFPASLLSDGINTIHFSFVWLFGKRTSTRFYRCSFFWNWHLK